MRGRRWVIVAVMGVLLAGGAAWWFARSGPPKKTPPSVTINDPVVAAAVEKARAEVLAQPTDAARWGRLGQTFLANGLLEPARECLAEASRLDPRDPRWPYLEGVSLLLTDPVAAHPCWERAAQCPGDDDQAIVARLRWTEVLIANNRLAEADEVLRKVLLKRPYDARVHFNLGLLAIAQNDFDASISHFKKCADDPSARRKASTHLAAIYTAKGMKPEADAVARRVEELPADYDWPDPFLESYLPLTVGREALFIQAEKQQLQGNVRQAIMLFQTVIEKYPDEGRAYTKLGMILAELGEFRAAEQVLRDGIRVAPNMVQTHFFLAAAVFPQAERSGFGTDAGKEKLKQTVEAAKRATELKPDHGFAHLYLGLALRGLGRKVEGLAALREAVRCTPEAADPHLHLGQALWDDGQQESGIAELELAVQLASPADNRPRVALERMKSGKPPPE